MMDTIQSLAIGLVVTVIVAAVGAMVLTKFKAQITDNSSTEYQVVDQGSSTMKTLADFLPIVVVAGIGFGLISFFLLKSTPARQ